MAEPQQDAEDEVREKQEILLQMLGDLRNDVVRRMSQRLLRVCDDVILVQYRQ